MAKNGTVSEFDRKADAPKTKPRKAEQGELIDTDHPEDKPLIKQIKKVASCNRAESAARENSTEERTKLIDMMKERKLESYKHGTISVNLKHTDKVSVKTEEDNGDANDND